MGVDVFYEKMKRKNYRMLFGCVFVLLLFRQMASSKKVSQIVVTEKKNQSIIQTLLKELEQEEEKFHKTILRMSTEDKIKFAIEK